MAVEPQGEQPQPITLEDLSEKDMASFLSWVKSNKPWTPRRTYDQTTSAQRPLNILWVTKEGSSLRLDPRTEGEGRTGELIGSLFCYDSVFELLSGKEVRC